jgi:predicted phage tail protein
MSRRLSAVGVSQYGNRGTDRHVVAIIRREETSVSHHLIVSMLAQPDAAGFILRGIKGVFVIVGSLIAAVLCAIIAAAKGRSALLFGVLGLFFSILTLIVVIVMPRKRQHA